MAHLFEPQVFYEGMEPSDEVAHRPVRWDLSLLFVCACVYVCVRVCLCV